MSETFDDKSPVVIPFIVSHLEKHRQARPNEPFFIGLNGVQGAGKTVLVTSLKTTLAEKGLTTTVFSLDDLYLTHEDQEDLAKANPSNPLLQHRGQPSTHDIQLALSIFASLKANQPTRIPKYNKALFSGQGDRLPESEWDTVNSPGSPRVDIVLFEGWCVGFQPLTFDEVANKHTSASTERQEGTSNYRGRLGHNSLESVTTINDALKQYLELWSYFDTFVHIDAADPLYVYKWRLQQEATTRKEKGGGMTDEQVENFVNGYYPAYELYTSTLRDGIFRPKHGSEDDDSWKDRQLRLVVDEGRKVKEVITI
jgi:D-glycerate 3-kinase